MIFRQDISHYIASTILISLLLFFSACNTNNIDSHNNVPLEESNEMYFAIKLPSSTSTKTPSNKFDSKTGVPFDTNIDHIDILLFDKQQNYVRSIFSRNIDKGGDRNTQIAKVKLPNGEYHIVMFANIHDIILDNEELLVAGKHKDEIIPNFTFNLNQHTNKWNAVPGSQGYRNFPMWGEVEQTIKIPVTSDKNEINLELVRMLAKINLEVDYETLPEGMKDFALKEVYVYNHNKKGYVAPLDANWTGAEKLATEFPSQSSNGTDFLLYDNSSNYKHIDEEANRIIDEIFVFESKATTSSQWNSNICLIMGGNYNGESSLNYYRLDLAIDDIPFDIVRNHSYNLTIKQIKTFGYDTPQEALKNEPNDVDYTITTWTHEDIGDIIVWGQTRLSIYPQSQFELHNNLSVVELTIGTDHEFGWHVPQYDNGVYKITDENNQPIDWLSLDKYSSDQAGENSVKITVAKNTSNKSRTGYIYITARNIEHKLRVIQSSIAPTYLDVSEKSFLFDGKGRLFNELTKSWEMVSSADVMIEWSPESIACNIGRTDIDNQGIDKIFASKTDNSGNYILDIYPGVINFSGRPSILVDDQTKLTVSIINPAAGAILQEEIFIRQVNYSIISDPLEGYFPDGKEYSFKVKSTVAWRVKEVTDEHGILQNIDAIKAQTGEINIDDGNDFFFTIINSQEIAIMGKKAIVILEDPTGMADDEIVEITATDCGLGGTPIPMYISANGYKNDDKGTSYLAHYYGDGANRRCWMVQNTREGSSSSSFVSTVYGAVSSSHNTNSKYGYYYKSYGSGVVGSVCPPGWRQPNKAEAQALKSELDNGGGAAHPAAKYWYDAEYAHGYGRNKSSWGSSWSWYSNGQEGIWWVGSEMISANVRSKTMSISNLSSIVNAANLRCVRN